MSWKTTAFHTAGKPRKACSCGLHARIGEVERADHRHDDPGSGGIGLREEVAQREHQGRHQNIGREVDDQIERRAVEPGQPLLDVDACGRADRRSRRRSWRGRGSRKTNLPRALGRGDCRHQGKGSAARREQMDRPNAQIFRHSLPCPCRRLAGLGAMLGRSAVAWQGLPPTGDIWIGIPWAVARPCLSFCRKCPR